MAIFMRRWLSPGPNVDAELADHQDVDMKDDVNEVAVALPARKGKRKAAVLVAEQPDADLHPPPAKQAHVVVMPLKFLPI
jgi:hypothetical protein